MYKDTKHLCEDFILDENKDAMGILKWVPCKNGDRIGSFYKCNKFHGLMCSYHWKPTYN